MGLVMTPLSEPGHRPPVEQTLHRDIVVEDEAYMAVIYPLNATDRRSKVRAWSGLRARPAGMKEISISSFMVRPRLSWVTRRLQTVDR